MTNEKQKRHCDIAIHTLRLTVSNRFYLSQGEYDEHKKPIPTSCLLSVIALTTSSISHADITLTSDSNWKASVSGSLPVFMVISDFDKGEEEKATRIMSGFNPVNLTFHVTAPEFNGITVSSHVQIDTHLQGSQTQNSGTFESRVAEIKVSGDFGTFNVGKGFGIFNSSTIGDLGSGMGVGLLGILQLNVLWQTLFVGRVVFADNKRL